MQSRQKHTLWRVALFSAALLLATKSASAATFCVAGVGIAPQCYYDDISSCVSSAGTANGSCVINPDATPTFFGGSRYCSVQSDLTAQCIFVDRSQCSTEAAKNNAICIDRTEVKGAEVNPFLYDDRIQN